MSAWYYNHSWYIRYKSCLVGIDCDLLVILELLHQITDRILINWLYVFSIQLASLVVYECSIQLNILNTDSTYTELDTWNYCFNVLMSVILYLHIEEFGSFEEGQEFVKMKYFLSKLLRKLMLECACMTAAIYVRWNWRGLKYVKI